MKLILLQRNFRRKLVLYIIFILSPSLSVGQTWHEVIRLTASDADSYDNFGVSVSISGDFAIVGSLNNGDHGSSSGSAYIFELIDGIWTEVEKLTASDAAANDYFGNSVGISGDLAIIGAYGNHDDGMGGSAYIFELIDGIWTEVEILAASDALTGFQFGASVSISGDKIVVGDRRDNDFGSNSGSAYIFELIDGLWTEVGKLTASDAAAESYFGHSVSISGDHVVIGANGNDDFGANSGSAYIFEFEGGVWVETAKLNASDAAEEDNFGNYVSISIDHAIVGATRNDDDGAAYIFELIDGIWTEMEKLTASDAVAGDRFGSSVNISGDRAVVGAYGDDSSSGSAYIFELIDGIWTEVEKITASDAAAYDFFGVSVAISGDQVIIGAYGDGGISNSGSAYIFEPCVDFPTVIASASDLEVCLGDEVILNGDGAVTYTWDGGVTDGVAFVPEIGTTTYTVTGKDDIGCGNTDSIDITVIPLPEVTATADTTEVCFGGEVTLTGGGAASYIWDGGVMDGEIFTPEIGITTYTVTGTDDLGCHNTATIDISVFEISISYTSTDEMFGDDASINLTVSGGSEPYSFDWDNDGLGDFDDDEDLIDITSGTYIVMVEDEVGCVATATIEVGSELSIESLNTEMTVYPIPSSDMVTIELQGAFVYSLVSLKGEILMEANAENKAIIDLRAFVDGIYFVRVQSEGISKVVKLVKE